MRLLTSCMRHISSDLHAEGKGGAGEASQHVACSCREGKGCMREQRVRVQRVHVRAVSEGAEGACMRSG